MRIDATEVGRNADRAHEIAADSQTPKPRGQRSRAPACRSTRREVKIPGIVGSSVDWVVALPIANMVDTLVLPRTIAPADSRRSTATAVRGLIAFLSGGKPQVLGDPR
jgi:hypothetical protein